jgi:hypothetical protein
MGLPEFFNNLWHIVLVSHHRLAEIVKDDFHLFSSNHAQFVFDQICEDHGKKEDDLFVVPDHINCQVDRAFTAVNSVIEVKSLHCPPPPELKLTDNSCLFSNEVFGHYMLLQRKRKLYQIKKRTCKETDKEFLYRSFFYYSCTLRNCTRPLRQFFPAGLWQYHADYIIRPLRALPM